jgi:hypothetical protein
MSFFLEVEHPVILIGLHQSEMNDDHLYQDPEYSWGKHIQA